MKKGITFWQLSKKLQTMKIYKKIHDLRKEMQLLKTITFNDYIYNIEYFLGGGGGWKFLGQENCNKSGSVQNQNFVPIYSS